MAGWVTLANAVFDGPVLKKKKKTPRPAATTTNPETERPGINNYKTGTRAKCPARKPEKYDPLNRDRNLSPATPPANVAANPPTTTK